MNNETKELLHHLLKIDSVSGDEKEISNALQQEYKAYADDIVYDNLGSIYAVKKSKKENAPHVMVTGHMDTNGFIIKKFNDNGTVVALGLGQIKKNSLLGARVRVNIRQNNTSIEGIIVSYNEKDDALTPDKEVLLDFGFVSKKEAQESGLHFGDRVSFFDQAFLSYNKNRMFARNWDGRYAPILGLELLKAVEKESFDFDLYVGCTVQEQVGLRGIQTATNLVKPDLGIVLDTNKAFDYQKGVQDCIGVLGKGLLINYYDTTVLPNRLLLSTLKQLCKEEKIAFQFYYSMEGSDAAWINKLRTGAPTLFINVPIREMNTPSSVMDLNDYNAAKRALLSFVKGLTPEKIQAFKEENR